MEFWNKQFRELMFSGVMPENLENVFEASVNILYGEICKKIRAEKENGSIGLFLHELETFDEQKKQELVKLFIRLMQSNVAK